MIRLVEEGGYIAKVPVTLIYETDDPTNWGPYLSMDDALKLERVQEALEKGDIAAASREAKVFQLTPVSA
ncbi:MAG: hypothetical protein Q8K28_02930 [Hoeflea sp.]|uniref:hypothetical protein n=1 Tax=Hoeflea sp. TaxID=1940281 RepID=UPI00273153A9|nr:hypothetical protein [Hoeflea sp.]MDP2118836.1 hypothetical protein [Hoeflea sp.]